MNQKVVLSMMLGLASVSASHAAALEHYCSDSALAADHSENGFYASVTGYWLQPSETDIGMVTDSWQTGGNGTTIDSDRSAEPKHKFEGGFTLGYDFHDSANSLELNYYHMDNESHEVNAAGGETLFTSYFFPGASFTPATGFVSDAKLKYRLNQADLKLTRKYTQCDTGFSFRPALGIRYVNLKHDFTFKAPGYVRSAYDGWGPMVSIDGSYELGNGFSLIGYLDSSLHVGHTDSETFLGFGGGNAFFKAHDIDRIVTTLTGRLGLGYKHVMNKSVLNAEVGYQMSEYFNAFDMVRGNVTFNPALTGAGINDIITTNFGVNGPYVRVGFSVV